MTGEDGYTVPRRAVPNSNGLVVGGRDLKDMVHRERSARSPEAGAYNPRHFMMKLNGADVIQMPMQSKKTSSILWSDIL